MPVMLTSDEAAALALAKGCTASPKAIERLAKEYGAEVARWAFEQWDLRTRAQAKFSSFWNEMLFEREALEQATHEQVAEYRASRFPQGVTVADLTCSIGADLISLARRGAVIGIDTDLSRLELAAHNLAVCGVEAELIEGDSLEIEWAFDYAFADPSRRVEGKRTLDLASFQPNPRFMAERLSRLKLGAMKLSPMIPDAELLNLSDSLEFWSFGGEAREAVLWFGERKQPGVRAVHVESGETLQRSPQPPTVPEPSKWLFEADPAAIRANALGDLCSAHRLEALGTSNGYLTASDPVESPFLKAYSVVRTSRPDIKSLQAVLTQLGSSRPVVKSRLPGFNATAFGRRLRANGDRQLLVVLYPVGRSVRAVIAERP